MDLINQNVLTELAKKSGGNKVSIYLPNLTSGQNIKQNRIRLKNIFHEAKEELVERGLSPEGADKFLAPAHKYMQEELDWHYDKSLCVFIDEKGYQHYLVPLKFEEYLFVGNQYFIKPLLELITNNGNYYLLTLSQKEANLYDCTHFKINKIDLPGIPDGIKDTLKYDDPERSIQYHTASNKKDAMYHGQGVGTDEKKRNLERYIHEVEKGVTEKIKNQAKPLLLFGLSENTSIYKKISSYKNTLDKTVDKNPENVPEQELKETSWENVKALFQSPVENVIEKYKSLANNGKTEDNLEKILKASYNSRIDSLFIVDNVDIWGKYDYNNNDLNIHEEENAENEELLNTAVINTLINGGQVYILNKDNLPANSNTAAILRF